MDSWLSVSAAVASIALFLALELGRDAVDAKSHALSTLDGLVAFPAAVVSVWALALSIGWWTPVPLTAALLLAGRKNLRSWSNGQPIASLVVIAIAGFAWILRFF